MRSTTSAARPPAAGGVLGEGCTPNDTATDPQEGSATAATAVKTAPRTGSDLAPTLPVTRTRKLDVIGIAPIDGGDRIQDVLNAEAGVLLALLQGRSDEIADTLPLMIGTGAYNEGFEALARLGSGDVRAGLELREDGRRQATRPGLAVAVAGAAARGERAPTT